MVGLVGPKMMRRPPPWWFVEKTRAGEGVTGHNVRYVLGFGLAGVIIAFLAIWIYFSLGRQPHDISVDPTGHPQSPISR